MRYLDGQEVIIGDKVSLGTDEGIVICSIDRNEFSLEYPKDKWCYLEKGVLISFSDFGPVHYTETDPNLKLLSRRVPSKRVE